MPSGLCLSARLPGLVAGSFLTRRAQPSSLTPGQRGSSPHAGDSQRDQQASCCGESRRRGTWALDWAGGRAWQWKGEALPLGQLLRPPVVGRGRQAPPDGPAAGGRADRSGVLWNCPAARALRRCHGRFPLRALWGPHCVG